MVSMLFLLLAPSILAVVTGAPSFTVDFNKHTFLKDGEPFRYIAGSYHYSRVPFSYWRDRLQKMYAAGLDAVQVYVPWNVHEPEDGVYDFQGQQDIVKFIKMAQEENLLVILRAGPYICGEWEFGGFPAWILRDNSSIVLRTMDPVYIKYVDRWMGILLSKIKPLIYSAGGNVIMIQVENEYGSYFACDHDYMGHLVDLFRKHVGDDVILFSTDGSGDNFLKCGPHDGLLTTVDFGPTGNVTNAFSPLVRYQPNGPLVNSEYYTGWLDYWGNGHAHTDKDTVVKTLKDMLDVGASVNLYMFEGGTNFGYYNGADPPYNVCPTSYDYDAPLSEAGDITDKYTAIRELLGKYKKLPPGPVPPSTPKSAYGKVVMSPIGSVHELLPHLTSAHLRGVSQYPLTMEQMGQNLGFILYKTVLKFDSSGSKLDCSGVRDMGYVMLDGEFVGLVDRNGATSLNLIAASGQELSIMVENMGRINFGSQINNNTKGLISNVTLGGKVLQGWDIHPLNFTQAFGLTHRVNTQPRSNSISPSPAVYMSRFTLPSSLSTPQDTFLDPTGWFKGQAFINGFNLGRYWPVRGPQVTLFVPACVLRPYPEENVLVMVELQRAPCPASCHVNMTDTSYINKPISETPNTLLEDSRRHGDETVMNSERSDSRLYFKPTEA